ncbi:hemin-degrading factor [Ketogulonicigenium vulgare]|uniref:hemin-degrading factor n=1 Tax=Ketogulonicigenium vulgare TaxID=92945 RepID=UPI0001E6741A|nr:hemin-degrading factor [Ketogulonicigenium vulgare]ADO41353.1 hemin degrading factor [Ketogulonicigenium vulgare Y25]ALJ81498.1 hemin degrading factor [Ketogulonicigenium vulgare]ANW34207.1 hemin degrading factor [Ketogulonicigenium vulgare]AOZ55104.1 hemin degrading factor [Ketogulonicigenium vulgare]
MAAADTHAQIPTPAEIRQARADNPKARDRDLAESLGVSEAALVAAYVGHGVTRIAANPDQLMPLIPALGEVMALTRNEACVHEKVGTYSEYHANPHAGSVLNPNIDLRTFPKHWVHGFVLEKETETGTRRSIQVFDSAGDAVHKIFLREGSNVEALEAVKDALRLPEQSDVVETTARPAVQGPKADPSKADALRADWQAMTDTHQFLRMVSGLGMNRLGAYHTVGAPYARLLDKTAFQAMLDGVVAQEIGIMIFVGNRGMIQIHTGPIYKLMPMGPWQNIMDPGFNLHLRADKIAEVWAVTKPTSRGDAISIEAFDAEGDIILQVFGVQKPGMEHRPMWNALVEALPSAQVEEVA